MAVFFHRPQVLADALAGQEALGRRLLAALWLRQAEGRPPQRRALYALRSMAYLRAGLAQQARRSMMTLAAAAAAAAAALFVLRQPSPLPPSAIPSSVTS